MMSRLEVSPADIETAIRRFGANTGGGFIDQHAREYLIRNIGLTNRLEDLRNLVVATRQGHSILLRQVAQVEFAARVKRGDAGYMGNPAVIVGIQKQPTADTISLTRAVEAQLDSIQKTLPQGVTANKVQFRQATFIETSIANVEARAGGGGARGRRRAVPVPDERARDADLAHGHSDLDPHHGAGVQGLRPVDQHHDARADWRSPSARWSMTRWSAVENIYRRLKENAQQPNPQPALEVIARASQEVRSGILYATVIIILVFVPLFALSGIEGRLFVPLGIAYIVSILGSLVTSITVTPVLAYYLLPAVKAQAHGDSFLVRKLKAGNTRLLHWAFRRTGVLFAAVLLGVAAAGIGAFLLPRTFLPPFNEGTILVNLQYNPGISLAESNRLGAIAERLLMTIPEVKSLGRRTGRAELDEHAEGVHNSEIDVDLARSMRSKEEIYANIRAKLAVLPVVGGHRPADRAPHRSHAVGRPGADRAQDLRRRSRHAAFGGRAACARACRRCPASSTCRWKSRC